MALEGLQPKKPMPLEPMHGVQLLILQESDTGRSATKGQ